MGPHFLSTVIMIGGVLAGLLVFLRGFRVYGEYRLLADTPEQPIASLPMGRVRVHGKVFADKVTQSPLSATPCVYWRTEVRRGTSILGVQTRWNSASEEGSVPFSVEDKTGRVAVDASGAQLDLNPTFERTGSEADAHWRQVWLGEGDPFAALPGQTTNASVIAYAESALHRKGVREQGPIAKRLEPLKRWMEAGSEIRLTWNFSENPESAGPHYHVKEYCLLPGHWYDVTGTCYPNAEAEGKTGGPPNIIAKGENDPTFLISWRAEANVVRKLRRAAMGRISGGSALALISAFMLLRAFDLL